MAFAVPSAAQPANGGLLQQAGQAYAQGDYGQALALYDSVNTQYTSAGLLFNIGNCYSKVINCVKLKDTGNFGHSAPV